MPSMLCADTSAFHGHTPQQFDTFWRALRRSVLDSTQESTSVTAGREFSTGFGHGAIRGRCPTFCWTEAVGCYGKSTAQTFQGMNCKPCLIKCTEDTHWKSKLLDVVLFVMVPVS